MFEGLNLVFDVDIIAGFTYRYGSIYRFKYLGWHQIVLCKTAF